MHASRLINERISVNERNTLQMMDVIHVKPPYIGGPIVKFFDETHVYSLLRSPQPAKDEVVLSQNMHTRKASILSIICFKLIVYCRIYSGTAWRGRYMLQCYLQAHAGAGRVTFRVYSPGGGTFLHDVTTAILK